MYKSACHDVMQEKGIEEAYAEVVLQEALDGSAEALDREWPGRGVQQEVRQRRLLPLLQRRAGRQVLHTGVLPRHCALCQHLVLQFLIPACTQAAVPHGVVCSGSYDMHAV